MFRISAFGVMRAKHFWSDFPPVTMYTMLDPTWTINCCGITSQNPRYSPKACCPSSVNRSKRLPVSDSWSWINSQTVYHVTNHATRIARIPGILCQELGHYIMSIHFEIDGSINNFIIFQDVNYIFFSENDQQWFLIWNWKMTSYLKSKIYQPSRAKTSGKPSTPAPTIAVTQWKAEYHHFALRDAVIGNQLFNSASVFGLGFGSAYSTIQ